MGIHLSEAAQAIVMTEDDFRRIKDHVKSHASENPIGRRRGRPRTKTVATAS